MSRTVTVGPVNWPLHKPFKISREVATHAETIVCEISDGRHRGRGEAAGVSYGGETIASIQSQIEAIGSDIERATAGASNIGTHVCRQTIGQADR